MQLVTRHGQKRVISLNTREIESQESKPRDTGSTWALESKEHLSSFQNPFL